MRAIYKRELDSYFHSMIGYVFISFFLAFTGVYFMAYNLNYGYPIFSYVLSSLVFILLIAIPVLTMKSFSEDRKSRTDQLLLTAPVSLGQIVLGKYLAMVTVYLIPNLVFCLYPLVIKMQGNAYLLTDYCGILVFFLMGCVFIAIGMFLSSLTEIQIIAAISSFGVLLILYLWNGILGFLPSSALLNLIILLVLLTLISALVWHITGNPVMAGILEVIFLAAGVIVYAVDSGLYESLLSDVLGQLDLTAPLTDVVSSSLLDTGSIILYLSVIWLFIFLTMQSIQKRRWSYEERKIMDKIKHSFNSIASKQGSYSVGLTALVIAIVVLINLIVGQLPSQVRQIDISTNNIYEITDTSRELLDGLDRDVTFTVLADKSSTDKRIRNFIDRYSALSSHISVEWIDPVLHPSALTTYSADSDTIVVS